MATMVKDHADRYEHQAFVQAILDRMTFKPGWTLRAELMSGSSGETDLWLAAYHTEPDSRAPGEEKPDFRRSWPLDGSSAWPRIELTEVHVVAVLRHALHEWGHHEIDEWLRLDDEIVHDPHKCPQCLVGGCRV